MMFFSAWYHLNLCQSEHKMYFWRKFDLVGIVLQMMGSQIPPNYYNFYCPDMQKYAWRYVGFSWTVCILACAIMFLPMGLTGNKKHYYCAGAFIAAGWSTSPLGIHTGFFKDPVRMPGTENFLWFSGGLLYTFGAIVYALKFPERFMKGRFDIFGSSHQIFHVSILMASLLHFYASINEYHTRQLHQCPV